MTDQNKEWYIGSGGELEQYVDAYKLTKEQIDEAEECENAILETKKSIENGFLTIGALLMHMEDNKLYLGRGYPTFKAYANSSALGMNYRMAHDLVRIVREVGPKLESAREQGRNIPLPSMSNMRAALPMLSENLTDDEFLDVLEDIEPLTVSDANKYIRERRGLGTNENEVTFHARVHKGEVYNTVTIKRSGLDGDIYEMTAAPLKIKPKDFAKFIDRFGYFVEYV